METQSEKGRDN